MITIMAHFGGVVVPKYLSYYGPWSNKRLEGVLTKGWMVYWCGGGNEPWLDSEGSVNSKVQHL